jgi:hypothetical protein
VCVAGLAGVKRSTSTVFIDIFTSAPDLCRYGSSIGLVRHERLTCVKTTGVPNGSNAMEAHHVCSQPEQCIGRIEWSVGARNHSLLEFEPQCEA